MLNDREAAIDRLLDRMAIHDVLTRYSRAIDRCDIDLLKSVYWPEATDDHGVFNGDAHAFAEFIIPLLATNHSTMHALCNMYVELGEGEARSETYVIAYHDVDADAGREDLIIGGRYLDRLEKRGGEWRIIRRQFVMDWNQNLPATARWDIEPFIQLKVRGARTPNDPWDQGLPHL